MTKTIIIILMLTVKCLKVFPAGKGHLFKWLLSHDKELRDILMRQLGMLFRTFGIEIKDVT